MKKNKARIKERENTLFSHSLIYVYKEKKVQNRRRFFPKYINIFARILTYIINNYIANNQQQPIANNTTFFSPSYR